MSCVISQQKTMIRCNFRVKMRHLQQINTNSIRSTKTAIVYSKYSKNQINPERRRKHVGILRFHLE